MSTKIYRWRTHQFAVLFILRKVYRNPTYLFSEELISALYTWIFYFKSLLNFSQKSVKNSESALAKFDYVLWNLSVIYIYDILLIFNPRVVVYEELQTVDL